MLSEKQLKIFEVFAKKPFAQFTLKQIKEEAKEKSNNALAIAMKKYKKEQLLNEQKVGRSSLYSLNLNNNLNYNYITLANQNKLTHLSKKTLKLIQKSINKHTEFFSIIIFGSYSNNTQNKNSDLDIAIIIETNKFKKKIKLSLKTAELKSIIQLDSHIITKQEFLKMLKNEDENLGKQITRKHLAIHNPHIFYSIIQKGIKNGFQI